MDRLKLRSSRIMAWYRRNQLMFLLTGIFIMVLFIFGVIALAILNSNETEERRQQQSREQILCVLDKSSSPDCDQSKLDIKSLSQENVKLQNRVIFYQKCHMRMTSLHTQNPGTAIIIKDIYKCELAYKRANGQEESIKGTPTPDEFVAPSFNTPDQNPSNPSEDSSTDNNTEGEEPLLNCKVDIFFIHIDCPKVEA